MTKRATATLRLLRPTVFFWLILTMVSLIPIMLVYAHNQHQTSVQDLAIPVVQSLIIATITAALASVWLIKNRLGAVATGIVAVIFLTNNPSDQALSWARKLGLAHLSLSWQSVLFCVIVIIVSVAVGRVISAVLKLTKLDPREVARAVALAVTVIFVLLFIQAGRVVAAQWPQFFYQAPALTASTSIKSSKPDIYYIVLDDYTNQTVLTNQFGYDNSPFANYLTSLNYTVSPNAHSSYPYTTMSVASTLQAGYNSDLVTRFSTSQQQTLKPYDQAIKNSPVVRQLKSLGYSYTLIGNWYDTSNESVLADETVQDNGHLMIFGHSYTLSDFAAQEISDGLFGNWLTRGIGLGHTTYAKYQTQSTPDMIISGLASLKSMAGRAPGGRFIFAHLLVPHDQFFFNPDGTLATNSDGNNTGLPIKQKYTNQITFINSRIQDILATINAKSNGQAVVVLQSDEGPSPLEFNHSMFTQSALDKTLNNANMGDLTANDLQMKYGILAAYHIPAASADDITKAGDPVNVFRLVLDRYFGASMPFLPQCYYDYPKGLSRPFVFADITQRITGTTNTKCSPTSQ